MAAAEAETAAERKRKADAPAGAGKKAKVGNTPVEKKELLAEFHPAKSYLGSRMGFVFKLGAQGLGYYKDLSVKEMDAAERAATVNTEEIELDLDLEEEE